MELVQGMSLSEPKVGRIVHYVLSSQDGTMDHKVGQHRPAIIVHVYGWSETCVQLQVFTDGTNDRLDGANIIWVTSVVQDENDKLARTWHWPERD